MVTAMNSINLGQGVDEEDLEDELEALQQDELDRKMLETGSVPVDAIQRLPTVANGESTSPGMNPPPKPYVQITTY
jgi:charged multivesicular body protein 4